MSSGGSHISSVALARAKEAARAAELKAEIAMLEKRQALEEKKFLLQQEESRLNLEAEIAKTSAKEKAFAALLEKRQALEEKKFRLQQEESRLNLEAEIAKTSAKEKAFAALTTPSLSQLKPVKLESRFDDKDFTYAPPVEKPAVEKLHYCLLYTSPSPRDGLLSRMPSSA